MCHRGVGGTRRPIGLGNLDAAFPGSGWSTLPGARTQHPLGG
jgi:hypothetical protein